MATALGTLAERPLDASGEPTPRVTSGMRGIWPTLSRGARWIGSVGEWFFGLVSLILGLSVLATLPVLQFLSLGYLLEASGRIVRTGRVRDGLVGVRKAARLGSIVLGTWLVLWPARALSGLWQSSYLLNGDDHTTRAWRLALISATLLTVVHVVWAWFRGGRLRHFLWPAPLRLYRRLREGQVYADARDSTGRFLASLRLPYYFWLGARGFAAALLWLVVPVTLLVIASRVAQPAGVLLGWLGALSLAAVLVHLPFLQTHLAATHQWAAGFDRREIRRRFRHAPIAFWVALLATLGLALPLYLLKAELIPREAAWLPSLVFVVFILPARLLTGWAMARAERREQPAHALLRWLSWLGMLPLVGVYVLVVYFTQYISWYGAWSLYEQHAFLLPVPFLGM